MLRNGAISVNSEAKSRASDGEARQKVGRGRFPREPHPRPPTPQGQSAGAARAQSFGASAEEALALWPSGTRAIADRCSGWRRRPATIRRPPLRPPGAPRQAALRRQRTTPGHANAGRLRLPRPKETAGATATSRPQAATAPSPPRRARPAGALSPVSAARQGAAPLHPVPPNAHATMRAGLRRARGRSWTKRRPRAQDRGSTEWRRLAEHSTAALRVPSAGRGRACAQR